MGSNFQKLIIEKKEDHAYKYPILCAQINSSVFLMISSPFWEIQGVDLKCPLDYCKSL
jgi:hypothetical protein